MTIKFSVPIDAVPFKRPRFNRSTGATFNDKRYTAFKDALGFVAKVAMCGQPPLSGAVKISVDIYRNRKTLSKSFGDGDNHLKAVMDALTGICYLDDAQVTVGTFNKFHGTPHIVIELEEL